MRLPIQSMQAVRLRPSETDQWFRSVIVDFDPDKELIVLLPEDKDKEKDDSELPIGAVDLAGIDPALARAEVDPSADDDFIEPPLFNKGTRLEVEISFADGIRRFNSVVKRLELNYGGCLRIEWPTEGTRIQRRDYVRVDAVYRTLVWYRNEEDALVKTDGNTMDFSAGGVRLKMLEPLPAELRIEMEVAVPALKSQNLQGRVVRSGELELKRNEPQYYWVAVEFVGVDEGLRKEMTQVVFDIQRDQMRKSLT